MVTAREPLIGHRTHAVSVKSSGSRKNRDCATVGGMERWWSDMRLIDADALKEQCFKFADDVPRSAMAFAQGQINCAPTIDAVPVVRCRDCVNGELCLNSQGAEYVVCSMDEHHVWLPNGFCSYGERKDGDG